jgi:hypothetical protein
MEGDNIEAIERVKANMPDLSHLERGLRGKRALGNLLNVHGPPSTHGKQIADGFVQLVEKTLLEYEASRKRMLLYLRDGFADDYHRAQDHFESSIQSLHRSI